MKQKLISIITVLLITITTLGQKGIEAINGFKYAYVGLLNYENNAKDIYGISQYLRTELSKKGLIVLDYNSNNWPREAKINPYLNPTCYYIWLHHSY